ncbi:uncharacterized protein LOC115746589 [Rhodamnia argentea]|uniref:Uncharacterized protein LOC115746589 n=1 Tax=Rhodamnia argentea TaxID=178133 RepID=A0ABM3HEX3_9MYRT|nr:uncharacterized protein LOC115746589 [Rhodamnia argentea]XP_048135142.1 uncharacterized protein LOC115746589 [Rhodamnia argentea]
MDGGSSQGHRAEAERWLTAAAKLLATRDFQGTRTFAIRARESDPGLEYADHMLAVVDTLLAGESLVNNQPDWYAILQLGHLTQSLELIATHFRRLTLLLSPERNRFPFADQALRLVSDAWSVLSNPSKKALYDNELKLSLLGQLGSQTPPSRNIRGNDWNAPVENERPVFGNGTPVQPRPTRLASQATESVSATFWTACPYCYYLYEYPRVYAECVLKCQNCKRAFQAVVIPSPPVSEKDTHFSCWGFFPIGFPGLPSQTEGASGWMPMSRMVACPAPGQGTSQGEQKGGNAGQRPAPRVYYDDDDVYVELSESSADSGEEWGSKRKTRRVKRKSLGSRSVANKVPIERTRRGNADADEQGNNGGGDNVVSGTAAKGGERTESSKKGTESSKKATGSSTRKQTAKAGMGKLDLNVEFSNEVEEPARVVSQGNRTGNGEEDEGTEFFEGLDEFLSSLPILSVVNDDKVKAA